jgi:carboxyl-terminal processing protease
MPCPCGQISSEQIGYLVYLYPSPLRHYDVAMNLRKLWLPLIAFLVAQASHAQDLTADQKASVINGVAEILKTEAFVPGVDFKNWDSFLEKKTKEVDEAKDANALARVLNQALRDFGISHTRILNPRSAAQRGRTTAIGAGMQVAVDEKGLKVRRVSDSGPARAAGIEVNDMILTVNGVKPEKTEAVEGEKGAKFTLEIEKSSGEKKTLELELKEFSTVRLESVTWEGEDTAVLKVFTFSAGYGRENIDALIKQVHEKKAKNLILDLRSNGGGAVNNLNHLLSLLMPPRTDYGTFISKRIAKSYAESRPDAPLTPEAIAAWAPNKAKTREAKIPYFPGKIAVLINRGSGSASEICAAALRECVGAKVIGTPSAGAVLASVFKKLPEGFSIQYPVSDYVTIKGVRLEKNPVKPDVEVSTVRKEGEPDPVIEKALEALKENK